MKNFALEVELIRVIDGDTLLVKYNSAEYRVRIQNIDTEESNVIYNRDGKPIGKRVTAFGVETKKFAQQYWSAHKSVILEFENCSVPEECLRNPDFYGRLIAHAFSPVGDFYSYRLIQEGFSPYFNKYGNSRTYHEQFKSAQQYAFQAKLGIWSSPGTAPWMRYLSLLKWWNERSSKVDEFRVLEKQTEILDGACDNGCSLMAARKEPTPPYTYVVFGDFQRGIDALYPAGAAYKLGTKKNPITVWCDDNLIINQIESYSGSFKQNYLYVRGALAFYRGYPQLHVVEVGEHPSLFNDWGIEHTPTWKKREKILENVRRIVRSRLN